MSRRHSGCTFGQSVIKKIISMTQGLPHLRLLVSLVFKQLGLFQKESTCNTYNGEVKRVFEVVTSLEVGPEVVGGGEPTLIQTLIELQPSRGETEVHPTPVSLPSVSSSCGMFYVVKFSNHRLVLQSVGMGLSFALANSIRKECEIV